VENKKIIKIKNNRKEDGEGKKKEKEKNMKRESGEKEEV
jgi:hypothetical protein